MTGNPLWPRALLAVMLLACAWARATDEQLLNAALRCMHAGNWPVASQWLKKLHKAEDPAVRQRAVLLLAQSRFEMSDFEGSHAELIRGMMTAGELVSEYSFWMAECIFQKAEQAAEEDGARQTMFEEAVRAYKGMIKAHPGSPRLIDALVGQAKAHTRLRDWPSVVNLLKPSDGAFQKFIKVIPNSPQAVTGQLLLAEALYGSNRFEDALDKLMALRNGMLTQDQEWQKRHLQVRIEAGKGRLQKALGLAKALEASARNTDNKFLLVEALLLHVDVLRRASLPIEALVPMNDLLALDLPSIEHKRLLMEAVYLARAGGNLAQAVKYLDQCLILLGPGEMRAATLCARGEFCLTQFQSIIETDRPYWLEQARTNFVDALRDSPGGVLAGRAWLGRGWCQWLGRAPLSARQAFTEAAGRLQNVSWREHAQFKLAETLMRAGDNTNALTRFQELASTTNINSLLRVPAMYSVVRSALAMGDLTQAEAAVQQLQGQESSSMQLGEALLLLAQAQADANMTEPARATLEALRGQLPIDSLEEQEPLERARIEVMEKRYSHAARLYENWLKSISTNHPARSAVMFDMGWVHALDGNATASLSIFSSLADTQSNATQAPLAQMWIGDYYFNLGGTNYVRAEAAYQRVGQMKKCPTLLKYRSRLLAGRAAMARPNFQDAQKYFEDLAKDEGNCPVLVWSEAVFALADVTILESRGAAAGSVEKFEIAIGLFKKLIQRNVTNSIAARAWGRIGDCHLQLTDREPARRHEEAFKAYERALELVGNGTGPVFCLAKMGQALVRESESRSAGGVEKRNLIEQALGYYLEIFRGTRLERGRHNLYWLKQSGIAAGRLSEELLKRNQALKIYSELLKSFPAMKKHLQPRLNQLENVMSKPPDE